MARLENIARGFRNGVLATGLAASLFLFNCSKNPTASDDSGISPPTSQAELSQNTKVLNTTTANDVSSYDFQSGVLTFSDTNNNSQLNAGDILSSDKSPNLPYGLLAKVDSVSPDRKTFFTSLASIPEAVKNGRLRITEKLSPSASPSSENKMKGVSKQKSENDLFDFNLDLDSVEVIEGGYLDGKTSFNMDYDFLLSIKNNAVDTFLLKTTLTEKSDINAHISLPNLDINVDTNIYSHTFPSFTAWIPTSPPFPVVMVPRIDIKGNLTARSNLTFSAGISDTAQITAGVLYANSYWSPIKEFYHDFDYTPPTLEAGNLLAKAGIGPRFNLSPYGVFDGYTEAKGYLKLEADLLEDPWWKLHGGLEVNAGVDPGILKEFVPGYQVNILTLEELLAQADTALPPNLSNITRLTSIIGDEFHPSFSPDGSQIAFSQRKTNGFRDRSDLMIMNIDGTNPKNVLPGNYFGYLYLDWGKNNKIAFACMEETDSIYQIYIYDVPTEDITKITHDSGWYSMPAWSPEADKIALSVGYHIYDKSDIGVMDPDGSNLVNLTNDDSKDYFPSWSSDGSKIVYTSNKSGGLSLFFMDSNGENNFNYFPGGPSETHPSWRPNKEEVAIAGSNPSNSTDIYLIDLLTDTRTNLTNSIFGCSHPKWSRDGKYLLFSTDDSLYNTNKDIYVIDLSE